MVLVPVKAFDQAKVRLAGVMRAGERAELARAMATAVVAAAGPLPVVVVCDDDHVAAWAATVGARVLWTAGLGLNGAVQHGVEQLGAEGVQRVVVSHADLPLATGLSALVGDAGSAVLVPDRRRDGTNVASVPTDAGFHFSYGPASFGRHLLEAERCGLAVTVVDEERLAWDVDVPGDLDFPAHLLPAPTPGSLPT